MDTPKIPKTLEGISSKIKCDTYNRSVQRERNVSTTMMAEPDNQEKQRTGCSPNKTQQQ